MNFVIKHIIQQLQDLQSGHLWIGTNYHKTLKVMSESQMFVKPTADLCSVAEIVSHITLWRQEAILKITTGTGSKTDDCEENWLPMEVLKTKGWTQIKAEYDESLTMLIKLLNAKDDSFLEAMYFDTDFQGNYPYRFLLNGMLHHDLYHLGQLRIITKHIEKKNT